MTTSQSQLLPLRSLRPFEIIQGQGPISVSGQVELSVSGLLQVEFQLYDPQSRVKKPAAPAAYSEFARKDDLWKTTCFEVFLATPGTESYFEFNFSPWGAWNAYQFAAYRQPQPPQKVKDVQVLELLWENNRLTSRVQLGPQLLNPAQLEVSLTTVIETVSAEKIYFARNHKGPRPDFHLRESFEKLETRSK